MTLIACEYCNLKFNGRAKLYDHKRVHSAWRRKIRRGLDRWIKELERKKGKADGIRDLNPDSST